MSKEYHSNINKITARDAAALVKEQKVVQRSKKTILQQLEDTGLLEHINTQIHKRAYEQSYKVVFNITETVYKYLDINHALFTATGTEGIVVVLIKYLKEKGFIAFRNHDELTVLWHPRDHNYI